MKMYTRVANARMGAWGRQTCTFPHQNPWVTAHSPGVCKLVASPLFPYSRWVFHDGYWVHGQKISSKRLLIPQWQHEILHGLAFSINPITHSLTRHIILYGTRFLLRVGYTDNRLWESLNDGYSIPCRSNIWDTFLICHPKGSIIF